MAAVRAFREGAQSAPPDGDMGASMSSPEPVSSPDASAGGPTAGRRKVHDPEKEARQSEDLMRALARCSVNVLCADSWMAGLALENGRLLGKEHAHVVSVDGDVRCQQV